MSPAPATYVAVAAAVVALGPAGARWLRVAQREHYLAGAVMRFAVRWWRSEPLNLAVFASGVAGVVLSAWWPLVALAAAGAAAVGPVHLAVRGRTSPLVLTRRMKTLAAVWALPQAAVVAAGFAIGRPALLAAAGALVAPVLVDAALSVTAPIERRLSERYVTSAADRLRRMAPTVVAITGSYGKTSTKNHVAHLVSGSRTVVATPKSFNNRSGLARSVNEHLAQGTEVFVAEMGTYGPGEIRALCQWCPPQIAVLTAVGPVHLERFGTEDAILAAKSEITERASVVVVNADDRRLDQLAARLELPADAPATDDAPAALAPGTLVPADPAAPGTLVPSDPAAPAGLPHRHGRPGRPEVVRCSAEDETADVCVRRKGTTVAVTVAGQSVASEVPLTPGVQPTNLACAVAVALRLGVPIEAVVERLGSVPTVANRLTAGTAPSGVYVVDDTFNSNPAGARAALAALEAAPVEGRRAIVSPGMVELGPRQAVENEALARAATQVATDVVVVGRTNRRALVTGALAGGLEPVVVRTRQEAVSWVRANLGPGDAVLYENDLPDHYP